ncbi:MAG: Rdx family protein [Dehalococcoidia bacterium]|jgi:predicted Rdx family selenoprotein|nr:Rdx family protein [Dehalococcoidia bacterium]MDW8009395.1 Rdx family protein [Chloroflexota bacterium]
MAAWMAVEIWHEFGADAPVIVTPVHDGRFEVYVGGEKVFDRKAEGGIYPDLKKVREIKALIRQRLQALAAS